jgi:hypothetical protein
MPPAPDHPLQRVERKVGHRNHLAGPDPVARAGAQARRSHDGLVESPVRAPREVRPAVRTSPSGASRLSQLAPRRLRPTFRVEPRLTVRVTDLPAPACRHANTCSPCRVGRRGDERPQPEHPGTSIDTSNLPTSRGALSLCVRSLRPSRLGKVASATPRYSSFCANSRVRRPMAVRRQSADPGGPSVGFGALRRSQKRAATCTGLASPGCAAPSGFFNLLTRCSTRNPSGLVSCRSRPWALTFRGFPSPVAGPTFRWNLSPVPF